jgi:hypothetical protein
MQFHHNGNVEARLGVHGCMMLLHGIASGSWWRWLFLQGLHGPIRRLCSLTVQTRGKMLTVAEPLGVESWRLDYAIDTCACMSRTMGRASVTRSLTHVGSTSFGIAQGRLFIAVDCAFHGGIEFRKRSGMHVRTESLRLVGQMARDQRQVDMDPLLLLSTQRLSQADLESMRGGVRVRPA